MQRVLSLFLQDHRHDRPPPTRQHQVQHRYLYTIGCGFVTSTKRGAAANSGIMNEVRLRVLQEDACGHGLHTLQINAMSATMVQAHIHATTQDRPTTSMIVELQAKRDEVETEDLAMHSPRCHPENISLQDAEHPTGSEPTLASELAAKEEIIRQMKTARKEAGKRYWDLCLENWRLRWRVKVLEEQCGRGWEGTEEMRDNGRNDGHENGDISELEGDAVFDADMSKKTTFLNSDDQSGEGEGNDDEDKDEPTITTKAIEHQSPNNANKTLSNTLDVGSEILLPSQPAHRRRRPRHEHSRSPRRPCLED